VPHFQNGGADKTKIGTVIGPLKNGTFRRAFERGVEKQGIMYPKMGKRGFGVLWGDKIR
jgi:hypothetical protein